MWSALLSATNNQMTTDKIRKRVQDPQGNAITLMESGAVSLYLASIRQKRFLGSISFKERIFEVKRERYKHLMRANNSYGFNHHVLNKGGKLFDQIKLSDEYGEYLFSRTEVLERKMFMNFNKKGFELQIFYPLELITLKKINQPTFT